MAITAWSAKVCSSLICFSLNGCTSVRRSTIAPMLSRSLSIGTPRTLRPPSRFDIGGRRCNDAENFCASRLIGQGFGKVAGFCLHLVEQADVLGRDGGLIGKSRG